jgi:hypothetical protein
MLLELPNGTRVYHDLSDSLVAVVSMALRDRPVVAALGPLYREDPAAELLAPFRRTAEATGWTAAESLAPDWVWDRAHALRRAAVDKCLDTLSDESVGDLVDWTRAGVVLGYAQHHGVRVKGRGLLHVKWRLCGTVTGRFGVEPVRGPDWAFNPLSLGPDDRWAVIPRAEGRRIVVLDFKAMDLCSMASLVPGLSDRYRGHEDDMHFWTAAILYGAVPPPEARDEAKRELFVYAYGGRSTLEGKFDYHFPELGWLRRMSQGEAGRRVQAQSALAFRAALSRAMPLLTGEDVVPIFTVHDELALDCSERALDRVGDVVNALQAGASQRIGVPYRVGVSMGTCYEEAKNG